MKIFPHTLVRIAGTTFNDLENLRLDTDFAKSYLDAKENLNTIEQRINHDLFKLIGNLKNSDHQNLLLNLKRDIYNDRLEYKSELSDLLHMLPEEMENLLDKYFTKKKSLHEKRKALKIEYESQRNKIRKRFKKLVQDKTLQEGLLLSSKSLLKRIDPYVKKETREFSRNDFKAELGLLKYISRMKAKTSPFSTFTNLAIASHVGKNDHLYLDYNNSEIEKSSVQTHIRINNSIFVYLKTLLFEHSEIYPWLPISLNPTIQFENQEYVFLINHNNIESFQRIAFNPLLEFLAEYLGNCNSNLTYLELVKVLVDHVEASKDEISRYLKDLVDFGFLEYDLEVSGLDTDWDLKFRGILLPLEKEDIPFIRELREVLKKLREMATLYESVNFGEKETLLNEAFEILKSFCLKLHEAAGLPLEERLNESELKILRKKNTENKEQQKDQENTHRKNNQTEDKYSFKKKSSTWFHFKPKNIFYEDTSIDKDFKLCKSTTESIVSSLDVFLQYMQPFDSWENEKQKMYNYFSENYDAGKEVSLFSFYEGYYRDVKKKEAKNKNNTEADGGKGIGGVKKNTQKEDAPKKNTIFQKWQKNLQHLLEDEDLINTDVVWLNRNHLRKISDESGLKVDELKRCSFGTFIQFYQGINTNRDKQVKGVINSIFPGYGRMMSRFLHLFDGEITQNLRNWNNGLVYDDLLAENCDASCFNANIHPPLMPAEIKMPGGQNTYTKINQISVTDLIVTKKGSKLYLKSKKKGKAVYIFDLGFEGYKGHSQLFQLLSRFTLTKFLSPQILLTQINNQVFSRIAGDKQKGASKKIIVYPRIVFEDQIILQRKRWLIPLSTLPIQDSIESDCEYFLRINKWKTTYNMPNEVFITLLSRGENNNVEIKNEKRVGRDDYKPQYIDFRNPLLVNLFSKLLKKVPFNLRIDEMLPDSDHLAKYGGKKYVSEHMVQWYHY